MSSEFEKIHHAGGVIVEAKDTNVTQFKTQEQIVEELRNELRPMLSDVTKVMDKFTKAGFVVGFNILKNQAGQYVCQEILAQKFY